MAFVIKMVLGTLRLWRPGAWFDFWLSRSPDAVELGGRRIHLRSTPRLARIADLAMAWEVLVDRVYEVFPPTADDVVVDIGAHIGCFSVSRASQCPKGKVFAFEPHPESFNLLLRNLEGFPNSKAFRLGVGDRRGPAPLFVSTSNPAGNSLTRASGSSVDIDLVTLREVFELCQVDHIDLLKVDCEGAEYLIFKECDLDLLGKIERIVMEIHDPEHFDLAPDFKLENLVERLERSGLTVTYVHENRHQGYLYASRFENDLGMARPVTPPNRLLAGHG